jgi:hypothetical protein
MTDAFPQISAPGGLARACGIGVAGSAGDWWSVLAGVPWLGDAIHDPWKLAALGSPDARLLVMLCDPLARFATDQVVGPVRASANASFQRGLYADLLMRLWRVVPREQVLVLQQERCVRDTKTELTRTLEFLKPHGRPLDTLPSPPSKSPTSLRDDQRRTLARAYAPENQRLASLVPDLDLDLWEPAA